MERRSLKIKVEPSVLKYARYCSGFDTPEAARKIGIKEERLIFLERNQGEISIAKLEKIANTYKMPLPYFLLDKIPDDVILPGDFRIIYKAEEAGFSPKVMHAIRKARYVQFVIQELSDETLKYNFGRIRLNDDAEKVALYFRSILKVSMKEQSKWPNPSVALRNWKDAIERLNILVLQQSLPQDNIDAFSLADQEPYIIVLNSSEHENRRIFSLFHEIGHILLHRSGVCTPDDLSRNSFEYIRIEKFCNQFAASFLVPYEAFIENPIVKKLRKIPSGRWRDEDIREISMHFTVSQEVVYRRLATLNILSESRYRQKREELLRNFAEYSKGRKKKKIIVPQYRKIISQNGKTYVTFILEKLHSNQITLATAADYLDTNSRHISNVETNI